MSGPTMKCNTAKNRTTVEQYLSMFNPYESRPSIAIDLVALTRYAKKHGKVVKDLSENEIAAFRTQR